MRRIRDSIILLAVLCTAMLGCGEALYGGADEASIAHQDRTGAGGAGEGGFAGSGGVASAGADAGVAAAPGNTNVSLGGAQDFGYFRRLLQDGLIPTADQFDAAGFFAEHHTPLPTPVCGERICIQAMLGVMANLLNGENCTLVQLGLNSPIVASPDARPPLSLVVVVDTSGSMRDAGKMEFVREGLAQMVNELRDEDELALVTYSDDGRLAQPLTVMRGNRNAIHRQIEALNADGPTNLYAGLQVGYGHARESYDSGRQNRVLLLSDGQPTAGITDFDQILSLSRENNSNGIGLTSVGLGSGFNYGLMRGLAEQGDGNFYFVENAAAVQEVFTEELSYFTLPVAFDVEMIMRPGADYTIRRAVGSRFWETTDDGLGRLEVPSVFLAHRIAHDDVGPENTRRGGGSALLVELMPTQRADGSEEAAEGPTVVAEVELNFREPGTDRLVKQQVETIYSEGPDVLLFRGFFENAIVEKSFVMLNIYAGLVMASEMFHFERDLDGAVGLLQRLLAAVRDYEDSANGGEGDVDIQLDMELLQQVIDVMLSNGAVDPEEVPDEDPWPAD